MFDWLSGPLVRRALLAIALAGLALGLIAAGLGQSLWARWLWAGGTAPVVVGLAASMARDLLAGRLGVDAVALVSMSAALILGEPLAGVVVAIMYAGGNLLEDFAVARAERDLKALVDRARASPTAKAKAESRTSPSTRSRSATNCWCAPARLCPSTASCSAPERRWTNPR